MTVYGKLNGDRPGVKDETAVRIVQLEPMRVASVLGFSQSPEIDAWKKLYDYARDQRLLEALDEHRFFGFNNPSPSPGSPNYGYEQWITIGPRQEAQGEVQIIDFSGGLYAVARARGIPAIGPTWQRLAEWRVDSRYQPAYHQCLEECINPGLVLAELQALADPNATVFAEITLDLYLPILD